MLSVKENITIEVDQSKLRLLLNMKNLADYLDNLYEEIEEDDPRWSFVTFLWNKFVYKTGSSEWIDTVVEEYNRQLENMKIDTRI